MAIKPYLGEIVISVTMLDWAEGKDPYPYNVVYKVEIDDTDVIVEDFITHVAKFPGVVNIDRLIGDPDYF